MAKVSHSNPFLDDVLEPAPPTTHPTPGLWEYSTFTKPNGEPITTSKDVAATLTFSALQSDRAELWGVLVRTEAKPIICYTGNGPTSEANAAFITRACNSHYDLLASLKSAAITAHHYNKSFCSGDFDSCPNCREWRATIAQAEGR